MRILLLSNSAPNYHHFFKPLVRLFHEDGAAVAVAVDSEFSREENDLDDLNFAQIHEFSEFFRNHQTDWNILERYSDCNLNSALLSDYERSQIYGIWGGNVSVEYFDRLKSALLSFFETIFEQHGSEVVLYENVSNSFAHFSLIVAQKNGIKYAGIGGSRLPGRFSITSDPLHDVSIPRVFEKIREGEIEPNPEIRSWAKDYISQIETIVPDYMRVNGLEKISILSRYFKRERIGRILALSRHIGDSRTNNFQIGNPLLTHWGLFQRNVRRRLRASRVKKLYQNPVYGECFLLYPLHFHPESSTSILSGTWLNEYEVIRNIAFNLPEGMRLYVKDHTSAWAFPDLDFYRRLRALPNVRVLAPESPTKQLIRQSAAVITLTSTVGYEALLMRKRVFLFGSVFYEFHKGVTRVVNPAQLHDLLTSTVPFPIDWDDQYNEDFVCAYYMSTLPGRLNLLQGPEAAKATAEELYPILAPHIRP